MNWKSIRIGALTAGLFLGSSLLTSLLFGGDFGVLQMCLGIGWGAMMGVAVYVVDRRHRRRRNPKSAPNATVHSLLDRLQPNVTQCGRSCNQQGGTEECTAPHCYQRVASDTLTQHARRRRHGGQASAS